MKRRKISIRSYFTIVAFLFLQCHSPDAVKSLSASTDSLYTPTAADVTTTATLADLQAGRSLYINNCGRCHGLYTPGSFSTSVIPNMAARAGLSTSQATQITKYVTRGK